MSALAIIALIIVADLALSALIVRFFWVCEHKNGADW